jgi:hypothetical protein
MPTPFYSSRVPVSLKSCSPRVVLSGRVPFLREYHQRGRHSEERAREAWRDFRIGWSLSEGQRSSSCTPLFRLQDQQKFAFRYLPSTENARSTFPAMPPNRGR